MLYFACARYIIVIQKTVETKYKEDVLIEKLYAGDFL